MKRLQRPAAVYRDDIASVLTSAQRRSLHAALAVAVDQAGQYDAASPSLHSLRSQLSTKSARVFFVGLYASSKKAVVALKRRIRASLDDAMAAECQYCGGLAEPRTFDHFVGKADVPELALYAPNLVPCCFDCNNLRGPTFTASGDRRILHLYDDQVSAFPEFLVATVSHRRGVPAVTYAVATSRHPARALFHRHFTALRLAERYATKAASKLHVIKARARTLKVSVLKRELTSQADARNSVFGRNDHEATLLRAIAASPPTLTWLVAP